MVLTNLFAEKKRRRRHREWTVDTAGEGEGGMNRENSTDICTLPCVNKEQVGSCHITQRAPPVLWDDSDGWDGGGGQREAQEGRDIYI